MKFKIYLLSYNLNIILNKNSMSMYKIPTHLSGNLLTLNQLVVKPTKNNKNLPNI